MIPSVRHGLTVMVVVGALGLSGCSHDDLAGEGGNGEPAPVATGAVTNSADAEGEPEVVSIYGPLWDAFNGGTDFVTAELATNKAANEFLVDCMAESGFRYTIPPPDEAEIRATGLEIAYGTELADDSRRKTQGYGVTAYLVDPDVADGDNAPDPSGRDSLSQAEQAAFDKAEEACGTRMAYEFLPGELTDQVWNDSREVAARISADPEVVDAVKQWSRCLADFGYDFASMDEPALALEGESQDVEPGSSAATRLHEKELNLAEVDWSCREAHVNEVYLRVRDREEKAFVEQNFEVINELRERKHAIIFG